MVTILPVFQISRRIASRTAAISLMASARMCPTPSSTFSFDSSPFFGIDEFLGRGRQIGESLVAGPDPERQRLEALFAGFRGLASLLGLERKIEILEPLGIIGRANRGGKIGRELALALDRLEDRLFPLGELAQPLHAKLDLADDHLVEVAGRFLAVSRDEGNRVPIVQEPDDALDLRAPNLQVLRDTTQVHLNRVAHVDSTRHLVRQERRRCVRPIQGIARNSHLNGKSLALLKVKRTQTLTHLKSSVTLEDRSRLVKRARFVHDRLSIVSDTPVKAMVRRAAAGTIDSYEGWVPSRNSSMAFVALANPQPYRIHKASLVKSFKSCGMIARARKWFARW